MKRIKTLIFFLLCSFVITAQSPKFGKVSKDDLRQEYCAYDSLAKAEYLYHGCSIIYKYRESQNDFEVSYFYHDRIKIYDESAISIANLSLPYYNDKGKLDAEKITDVKAYTYNIENGEVKKTKVKKENIYDEEKSKDINIKKVAFPAVKPGSIVEIEYKLTSPYYFQLDEFYLQKEVPVRLAELEIETPEYFNYTFNSKGVVPYDQEQDSGTRSLRYKTSSEVGGLGARKTEQRTISYNVSINRFSAKEIQGVTDEPYVYTMTNYRTSIRPELLYTQYPNSPVKYYTKTWDDIAEILNGSDAFGKPLQKKYKQYDQLIASVVAVDTMTKIKTIFSEVQKAYTWNGDLSADCDVGIEKMMETGTGSVGDINLLLVNLLQRAGVEAYPVVSRASSSGFLNIANPSISDLNYVKAVVMLGQEVLYMDASDKHTKVGLLPYRSLGVKGVIIAGNKGRAIDFVNPNIAKSSQVYDLSIEGSSMMGTTKMSAKGHDAYLYRTSYDTEEELMEKAFSDFKITDRVIKNFTDNDADLDIEGTVMIDDAIQRFDGKIFIDLNEIIGASKNPFVSDTRTLSIFFPATINETKVVSINVPEGYVVESLPANLNTKLENGQYKVNIMYSQLLDKINIVVRETLTHSILPPIFYDGIKQMMDIKVDQLAEKIVLAKG